MMTAELTLWISLFYLLADLSFLSLILGSSRGWIITECVYSVTLDIPLNVGY